MLRENKLEISLHWRFLGGAAQFGLFGSVNKAAALPYAFPGGSPGTKLLI